MKGRLLTLLLCLYGLFVVYNTLLPFHFDYGWQDLPARLQTINWRYALRGVYRNSLTDLVGNIVLFVPFGFLFALRLAHLRHGLAWTGGASAALSIGIEMTQLFIPERGAALHDVVNNFGGGLMGASLALLYARLLSSHAATIVSTLWLRQPLLLLVIGGGMMQFLAAMMPFTVSITLSDLKQNLRAMNLMPFANQSLSLRFFGIPTPYDARPFAVLEFWQDVLFWAAGGYVLTLCYRLYWRHRPDGRLWLLGIPLTYFPSIECAQLVIISRVSDINDVLSGYLGWLLGLGLYILLAPLRRRMYRRTTDLYTIPVGLYGIFFLFSGMLPFDWTFTPELLLQRLTIQHLLPFYAYFQHTDLWNVYDLIATILSFVPISLYQAARLRARGVRWTAILWATTLLAGFLGTLVEGLQLFSLSRTGDLTDVLAYGGGGMLGAGTMYYYEQQLGAAHRQPPTTHPVVA